MPFTLRPLHVAVALAYALPVCAAPISSTVLPEILVLGEAGGAYRVPTTTSATRTETPIERIPQSVVVLPKAMLEDQGVTTLSDALRNVSNVSSVDARDSNLTGFRVRGFSASTIVDGVATPGVFQNQESLANVEQISVIKGPSGGLYGGSQGMNYSTIGGAIVLTTAEPQTVPIRQVSASLGSENHKGAGFDFNQAINDSVAIRLIGEYSDTNSEVDRLFFKRTGLFPSVSFTPNADTKVVVRLRQTENTTLDYPGMPRANAALPDVISGIPRSRFIGANGMPETTNESQGINVQWSQRLNDQWDFALTLAHNRLELDEYGAFNASVIDAFLGLFAIPPAFGSATQDIYGYRLWQEMASTVISPSLTGKFETGDFKHLLSLGVDHERSKEDAFLRFSDPLGLGISPLGGTAFFGGVGLDLTSATYPNWIEPPGTSVFDSAYSRTFKATTAYVQDQVDVGNWHLLGSLRMNHIDFQQGAASDSTSNRVLKITAMPSAFTTPQGRFFPS
jgi:iron complex outermembrane receptor protein